MAPSSISCYKSGVTRPQPNVSSSVCCAPTVGGTNIGQPAYDPKLNQLYVGAARDSPTRFNNAGLLGLAISAAPVCAVSVKWQHPNTSIDPAIPPIVANGVVYYTDGFGSRVFALDAATGAPLWTTIHITGGILAPPMVVNGRLFVAGGWTDHTIRGFGLQPTKLAGTHGERNARPGQPSSFGVSALGAFARIRSRSFSEVRGTPSPARSGPLAAR
jgi:hypothetical protein